MANTIEIDIIVKDESGNIIDKANDKLDEMVDNLGDLSRKQKTLSDNTKKSSSSLKIMDGVMLKLGQKAADFLTQVPAMAVELVKFGAEVQQQRIATNALAESFGTSGDAIIGSIQEASEFTISQMGAMQAANKAMVLDVANSPEAFARLTKVATELGKAMGQDATKSIDDFVTAAGRQSKQIADNLGLMVSIEDATQRYKEENNLLGQSLTDAQKKQAFLNEMLRQGEAKLGDLGDTSDTASVKLAKFTAAAEDAKAGIGEVLVDALSEAVGGVDEFTERIRGLPDTIRQLNVLGKAWIEASAAISELKNPVDAFNNSIRRQFALLDDTNPEVQRYANLNKDIPKIIDDSAKSFKQYEDAIKAVNKIQEENIGKVSKLSFVSFKTRKEIKENVKSQKELEMIVLAAAAAIDKETKAQEELRQQTLATNQIILDQGIAFTDFFRDVEEAEATHNKTLEELKTEHFANVAELEQRSRSTSIQLDAVAEEAKLAKLTQRLDLALLQQSEFTEKTKESTRLSKENQIAELQSQIGTQTQLLDDFYGGRLVAQGENVSGLLEAEQQRYLDEIAIQQENQALIEEEQRQSLGRMVIEAFEAWATMKGIPPDQMLEMRTALAEEYGLVEEGSTDLVKNVIASFEEMASGTGKTTDEVVADVANATDAMLNLKRGIDDLPTSKSINIDVTINQRKVGFGGSIGESMGEDFTGGVEAGIENGTPGVQSSIDDMTTSMLGSAAEGLGVNSPSWITRDMAHDVVEGFIVGVKEKEPEIEDTLESAFDLSNAFERAGGTAARMIQEKFLDPIIERQEGLQDQTSELQKEYEKLGETIGSDKLEGLNKQLDKAIRQQEEFTESTKESKQIDQQEKIAELQQEILDEQNEITNAEERRLEIEKQIVTFNEQGLALNEERVEQEERIARFKEAQQNLDFLKQQLDLVKLVAETGADPALLQDFQFGLDASLEDLVDITSSVLEDVGARVNAEISNIQTEAGLDPFASMFDYESITAGNVEQMLSNLFGGIFSDPAATGNTSTTNTTQNTAQFGDVNLNNGMDMATFMAMLNNSFNEVAV